VGLKQELPLQGGDQDWIDSALKPDQCGIETAEIPPVGAESVEGALKPDQCGIETRGFSSKPGPTTLLKPDQCGIETRPLPLVHCHLLHR
jgi:hypothetical protein